MNFNFLRPATLSPRRGFALWLSRAGLPGLLVIGVVSTAVVGALHVASGGGLQTDITDTISDAKMTAKQDGSREHPYAEESQCPRDTDLVFWPKTVGNDHTIANIPGEISVCFVQSLNNGPHLETRDR
jgi:hypothetical protein